MKIGTLMEKRPLALSRSLGNITMTEGKAKPEELEIIMAQDGLYLESPKTRKAFKVDLEAIADQAIKEGIFK